MKHRAGVHQLECHRKRLPRLFEERGRQEGSLMGQERAGQGGYGTSASRHGTAIFEPVCSSLFPAPEAPMRAVNVPGYKGGEKKHGRRGQLQSAAKEAGLHQQDSLWCILGPSSEADDDRL